MQVFVILSPKPCLQTESKKVRAIFGVWKFSIESNLHWDEIAPFNRFSKCVASTRYKVRNIQGLAPDQLQTQTQAERKFNG